MKSIPFLRVKKMINNFLILTKFKQFLNETFLGIFIYFILLYLATVINGMCVCLHVCPLTFFQVEKQKQRGELTWSREVAAWK